MVQDFILLDAQKNQVLSINELFAWQVNINTGERSRRTQLISHSAKSGATLMHPGYDEVQSLTFTNPLAMNLTTYNETLALIDQAVFVQFKGVSNDFNGCQPCAVVRAQMEWAAGNFLVGGLFTLELALLGPHFDNFDAAALRPALPLEPAEQHTLALTVPLMPASFSLTVQAHEPNGFIELSLQDHEPMISFSHIAGFGRDYHALTIDSQSNAIVAHSAGDELIDMANFVTGGAPFLLPTGPVTLQLRAQGLVSISQFIVRRRWRV